MTVDFPELELHLPSSPRITEDDYFHIKRLSQEIPDCIDMITSSSHDHIMASMSELAAPSSDESSLTSQTESIASEWMFFHTEPIITVDDVRMVAELDGRGMTTTANGHQVALFYFNDTIHCVDEKCPHAGGPLHEGDIEDMGPELCIVCPWHKFCFSLSDGRAVRPLGRTELLCVYPIKQDSDGCIRVGFKQFHPSCFYNEEF